MRTCISIAAAVVAAACSDPTPTASSPSPSSSSEVRFELAEGPLALGQVPFPSDLYRDEAGAIALGPLPNSLDGGPLFDQMRDLLSIRGGFCTVCQIRFEIPGGVDPGTLPSPAGPGEAADLWDPVVLVDVDPASPEVGAVIPLDLEWNADDEVLAVRPAAGFVLRRGRRYACAVTTAVHGPDGLPLSPSAAFERLRDGGLDAGLEEAAAEVVEPALAALDALGLPRDEIVGLAPFTTGDPPSLLSAVREEVRAGPAPVASLDRTWTGAELDELLGIPAEDRPGVDVPPAAGVEGSRAIGHATTSIVVTGTFPAPRFVEGLGSEIGAPSVDAGGLPVPVGEDDVPFVLIVPEGADLANLPVVVAQHGFNASRVIAFALADTAGRAGYAVLAVDGFQHGARAASARDELHQMRGDLEGPDGFAETTAVEVSGRMFGLFGAEPGLAVSPAYPLAAFLQLSADVMSLVRLVQEGNVDAVREADPSLASLRFDPDRVALVGNSMGAVVGSAVMGVEPELGAAVLNVQPGSIVETLAESGEFRTLTRDVLLPLIGVEGDFDEVERRLLFDPTVDLFRWTLEPVDPLALAPYLVEERLAGEVPDLLVQLASHDEVAAPRPSEAFVAAAGLPANGALDSVDVPVASLPAHAAAVRFEPAMHGMLEVLAQESAWEAPLVPPLEERDVPVVIENPIVAVHDQIEAFLSTYAEGGRAVVEAP